MTYVIIINLYFGIRLGTKIINRLAFAEDVVLISEWKEDLLQLTNFVIVGTGYVGWKINNKFQSKLTVVKKKGCLK